MLAARPLDERMRRWLADQVRDQQQDLGKLLSKKGLVVGGQAWVSRYINGKEATATLDHLAAIAEFFDRDLLELIIEACGDLVPLRRMPTRGVSVGQGSLVAQLLVHPAGREQIRAALDRGFHRTLQGPPIEPQDGGSKTVRRRARRTKSERGQHPPSGPRKTGT